MAILLNLVNVYVMQTITTHSFRLGAIQVLRNIRVVGGVQSSVTNVYGRALFKNTQFTQLYK